MLYVRILVKKASPVGLLLVFSPFFFQSPNHFNPACISRATWPLGAETATFAATTAVPRIRHLGLDSQVMVHANNDEMLTVSDWKAWVETHLRPVVDGLRGQRVYKEIFLAVGNESLAPWHVEKFGGRLVPCMKEVRALRR